MSDPQAELKRWFYEKTEPHGVKAKLAQDSGFTPTQISRMRNLNTDDPKKRQTIPIEMIEAAARFFNELPPGFGGMTQWVQPSGISGSVETRSATNASFPPRYEAFPSGTVPLLGQTAGGPNGRFILNGAEVGRLFCPPNLQGVEGAYAVRVYGTSMEPRYVAGEAVWLNPYEPVRAGDDVVVQVSTGPTEIESYIKRFVSKSAGILRLRQFNPDEGETEELTFDTKTVAAVHKVVFHAMA